MEERLAQQAFELASIARAENGALMLFLGEMAGQLAAGQPDPRQALRAMFSDAAAGTERLAARSDGSPEIEAILKIMADLRAKAEVTLALQVRRQAELHARQRDDHEP